MAVAERVQAAMATLSDGERNAIGMAYFSGHSYREVAELLGQPEGTVKSRIRNGLKTLRTRLSDVDLAPYWDQIYDPLWSAIEDLGIPISQHTGANEYLFELMDRDPTPAKGPLSRSRQRVGRTAFGTGHDPASRPHALEQ